ATGRGRARARPGRPRGSPNRSRAPPRSRRRGTGPHSGGDRASRECESPSRGRRRAVPRRELRSARSTGARTPLPAQPLRARAGELLKYERVPSRSPHGVDRRAFLKALAAAPFAPAIPDAPTLYNGIRLATPWPPRRRGLSLRPAPPPYLVDPPDVIPIDVGRQLFVDDFLIEETTLERIAHRPAYHAASPVLRPTTAWEKRDEYADRTKTRSNPAAMVFSDGVFHDPADRLF